jgi:pimeloyl-ACP methyl ester carboxylesterase
MVIREGDLQLPSGIKIHYARSGKGKQPIIFIHGLSNAWQVWAGCMGALYEEADCIAIDLPGCGLSSRGDYSYTIEFYVQAVRETCNILFPQQEVILCGHSMGGQIAARLSIEQPQMVKQLILIAPAGFEIYSPAEQMMFSLGNIITPLFASDTDLLETAITESFYSISDTGKRLRTVIVDMYKKDSPAAYKKMIQQSMQAMMKEPVLHDAKKITCPTLIIFGAQDQFIPNKMMHLGSPAQIGSLTQKAISKSILKMLPLCGHFAHVENYDQVSQEIMQFIK